MSVPKQKEPFQFLFLLTTRGIIVTNTASEGGERESILGLDLIEFSREFRLDLSTDSAKSLGDRLKKLYAALKTEKAEVYLRNRYISACGTVQFNAVSLH